MFNFSDDFFDSTFNEEIILPGNHIETYIESLTKFCKEDLNELKVLHLNINSVFLKIDSVHDILNTNSFDIVFLNETKLDSTVPNSYLSHKRYTLHRRDRDHSSGESQGRHGGGLLIFIRKKFIHTVELCDNFEAMHLRLTYNNSSANFLACYKSPSLNNFDFVEFLDSKVSILDLKEPIFIVGDLNMDLNSNNSKLLKEFMCDYKLKNCISQPTRIRSRIMKKNSIIRSSSTLIDVLIHNGDLVSKSIVVSCPFSDHNIIAGSIKIDKKRPCDDVIWSRNLSERNLSLISENLAKHDFTKLDKLNTCNEKWLYLKNIIISEADTIAPLKMIKIKPDNKCPWFDLELTKAKKARDSLYALAVNSNSEQDWNQYKISRNQFKYLNRTKIKQYFENKGTKDFKNSKKFWQFYKSSIKLRSDKNCSNEPNLIVKDNAQITEPSEIASLFNTYFTSIRSVSFSKMDESVQFIESHFNDLKKKKLLNTDIIGFSFKCVNAVEVSRVFNEISNSSSPGIAGIHPKILKLLPSILIPVLTKLFNFCISTNSIPDEWKSAVVTPLYKNKGSRADLNNYRAISVLPPIAKVFEKLLSSQITDYFETNKIFNSGQHGFRRGHSCETALHELISDINKSRDKN